jgi:hypothetical protein
VFEQQHTLVNLVCQRWSSQRFVIIPTYMFI